jgi:hypothetical protein
MHRRFSLRGYLRIVAKKSSHGSYRRTCRRVRANRDNRAATGMTRAVRCPPYGPSFFLENGGPTGPMLPENQLSKGERSFLRHCAKG